MIFNDGGKSRNTFECRRCMAAGNRSETYRSRPGMTPQFIDVCPRCRSIDIDVIAPEGVERTLGE